MLHRWIITLRRLEGTYVRNLNGSVVHEFETSQSEEIFLSPNSFRTTLGLTKPPFQSAFGFRLGLKRPERDVHQTHSYSAEIETE
jgi:hypothetical protein